MNGIVFFRTLDLDTVREFYTERVGCEVWLVQADCVVFQHGNLLFGFCTRAAADQEGLLTFVYDHREEVDAAHERFGDIADAAPILNEKYEVYHFFATDPEGRKIEFQSFEKEMLPY